MRDAPVNGKLKSNFFNHEQYGFFAYYGDQIYALLNFREQSLFAKGCKQNIKFNWRALTH
jgi:hypothetical protein